jgi:hypothetical protein
MHYIGPRRLAEFLRREKIGKGSPLSQLMNDRPPGHGAEKETLRQQTTFGMDAALQENTETF